MWEKIKEKIKEYGHYIALGILGIILASSISFNGGDTPLQDKPKVEPQKEISQINQFSEYSNAVPVPASVDTNLGADPQLYDGCHLLEVKRTSIENDIKNLKVQKPDQSYRSINGQERAELKGCEIAKLGSIPRTTVSFSGSTYDIEILEMNPIDNGVEIFVRAWDLNGEQIGFGRDGTVDIERFMQYQPPVLVEDPNGDILREWTLSDGTPQSRRLREDPKQAILNRLSAVINGKKQKHSGENIIKGKIGNTTSTFASVAGANFPVDGWLQNDNLSGSWPDTREGIPGIGGGDSTSFSELGSRTRPQVNHSFLIYDISSIAGGDSIDSANIQLWHKTVDDAENDANSYIALVKSCLASDSAIALTVDDFSAFEDINGVCGYADSVAMKEYSNRIDITDITAGQYQTYDLDAINGIPLVESARDGDGVVRLGAAEGHSINDDEPSADNEAHHYLVDQTGTANDPIFTVEHTEAAVTSQIIIIN